MTAVDGNGPPPTPDGYADPYRFAYPGLPLQIAAVLLTLASVVGFGWLLTVIQGDAALAGILEVSTDGSFTVNLVAVALPFLIAIVVTAVVHELIHGLAYRLFGHEVTYGVVPSMGAFYAAALGQFQTRETNVRVGAAPLLVITPVALLLLAAPFPMVATTAYFVLVLNTAGAVGDLYALWRFRQLPADTLLYDADIRHMYVFEPLAAPVE